MNNLKILECVDGSRESVKGARLCGKFAKMSGSNLILAHVLEDQVSYEEVPDTDIYRERKKEGEAILTQAMEIVEAEGGSCVTRLLVGSVAGSIVMLAEKEACDIICTGTRGQSGITRMLVGSVANQIIRYAHCPVTVVR